jgi:hypothetical protein
MSEQALAVGCGSAVLESSGESASMQRPRSKQACTQQRTSAAIWQLAGAKCAILNLPTQQTARGNPEAARSALTSCCPPLPYTPHTHHTCTPSATQSHRFFASVFGILGARVPQLMPSTSSNMRGSVMRGMERRTVKMAASFIRLARDAADQPCNEVKQEGRISLHYMDGPCLGNSRSLQSFPRLGDKQECACGRGRGQEQTYHT